MEKEYSQGFSPFFWGIAAFCLPIFLWPLALVTSTALLENPNLPKNHGLFMAYVFWFYPFVLGIIARFAVKWHPAKPQAAKLLLITCAIIFYALTAYIIMVGFH
ncbi:hypothetical protein EDC44_102138 [Cricetibacter osteomyelitidis]|uniref:Uncharacterized protein n=1 Tax=Cricetibacter osteomyelitidis TaxID=1521931 RepID=A0A4R2T8Z0_9PAST|nr:DUF5389 family protein [Cricetibacter osteomyelitidis]TCP97334.1 hypothetical protein EDC44_102138 [Cricetibacter osteomyelitidis]